MAVFSDFDRRAMARALVLAERGLNTTDPNPRVGCVIAHAESIVAEGWHERAGEPHAEIHALRAAGAAARGTTVYTTLEPCNHFGRTPPCVDALITAGVRRVVCAMEDPNPQVHGAGVERLRGAGISVDVGLMEVEARALNRGFVRRMRDGLPWIRLKLGVSLDGRTALANGTSRWITNEASRGDVQRWRARSSALLTGSGTVLADDPRLDVRPTPGVPAPRQPLRVIFDRELKVSPRSRILEPPGEVLIFMTTADAAKVAAVEARGARVELVPASDMATELRVVLKRLAELGMNEVQVEAGPRLSGALLEAGLLDELVIYVAPAILGSDARAMFQLPELQSLEKRWTLRFDDVMRVGDDLRIIATPISIRH